MVGYIISAVLFIIVIFLVIYILRLRKRMRKLGNDMEAFLNEEQIPGPYSLKEDCLAPLENAVSDMENRLVILQSRLDEERTRAGNLTADISHQLKTPLASLRLFCEMDQSPHASQQLGQIERMENLIRALLRLEKLSAGGYDFTFESCSIQSLIESVWSELRIIWPDRQLNIRGDAELKCERKWLSEAFENIVKNACLYADTVFVNIVPAEAAVYISIEDNGGGVPDEDLPRIFERFCKSRSAGKEPALLSSEMLPGSGLGLAIAREVILIHHGYINAENTTEGLRINIELPVYPLQEKFSLTKS